MMTRTVTVQANSDATPEEYAQQTARAIKALLLGLPDAITVATLQKVFASVGTEVQKQIERNWSANGG
jgi:hypothetical protein